MPQTKGRYYYCPDGSTFQSLAQARRGTRLPHERIDPGSQGILIEAFHTTRNGDFWRSCLIFSLAGYFMEIDYGFLECSRDCLLGERKVNTTKSIDKTGSSANNTWLPRPRKNKESSMMETTGRQLVPTPTTNQQENPS
mmetsp:Transcript_20028/g.41855  ORF Transcript_20028/g.41855 Transcript_20028/m.41855 type:complete len:139 (+) Transcript_20028:480-896(+)